MKHMKGQDSLVHEIHKRQRKSNLTNTGNYETRKMNNKWGRKEQRLFKTTRKKKWQEYVFNYQ
jgi:hypothetical protein